jgi:S-adenosylmethionine synthetase
LEEIARAVIADVGYQSVSKRCKVQDTVCQEVRDPAEWSAAVNDQAIVIGWAGYDAKTGWLAPEHHLAHTLRQALAAAMRGGPLQGHGPDGKLVVRVREEPGAWHFEHLLATVQQAPDSPVLDFTAQVLRVLREAYEALQRRDARWCTPWREVELLLSPNGPLLQGGGAGDNGQTGRKLVMDYYGPRVPLGGGALSGKHLSHIDRIGAYAAREAALRAVVSGAEECLVRVTWAPNVPVPLDVDYQLVGHGERQTVDWFDHRALLGRYHQKLDYQRLGQGTHFFGKRPWNRPVWLLPCGACEEPGCEFCEPPDTLCETCGALFRSSGEPYCSRECAVGEVRREA